MRNLPMLIGSLPWNSRVSTAAELPAGMMGDGLYGVDVKQTARGLKVIEVNDNPSIDAGVEDTLLSQAPYRRIIAEFVRRQKERGCKAAFVRV